MEFSQAWEEAADFLFSETRNCDHPLYDGYHACAVVCVEHQRYIPCRPCMYGEPASIPYSCKEEDLIMVGEWQPRK